MTSNLHRWCTILLVSLWPALASAASVTVSPPTATTPIGSNRVFTAALSGVSGSVRWEVNGQIGGSQNDGTITTAGVYYAPGSITTAPTVVTVTARSLTDLSVSGSAVVTVRNQIPWLTVVTPTAVAAGNPFTIDITGSRFVTGAQAFLNNAPLATTFISDTKLRATGSIALSQLGALTLRVDNPGGVASSTTLAMVGVPPSGPGSVSADTLDAVRFLSQATFGPTDQSISDLQQVGIDNWLAMQMDPTVTPMSLVPDGLSIHQVPTQWMGFMGQAPDQLRQRMAFALSQIFVVSRWKNTNGEEMSPWQRLLVTNAFGNFRTLLQEVTLSPTMGKYLDMVNSRRPAANENYARELMQLFTIGTYKLEQDGLASLDANGDTISTYDQSVVRSLALAFTGWVYPPLPGKPTGWNNPTNFIGQMVPYDPSHDTTKKVIFNGEVLPQGMSASAELTLALDKLFAHPNVPPFFATRLIRSLVKSNPSPDYVRRVADKFVNNGQGVRGDMAAVLKAVLTDDEARIPAPAPEDGHLKDPVLHIVGLVRAMGGQVVDASQILYLLGGLGQEPLASQSVFSFYSPLAMLPKRPDLYGPEFQIYTPALAIQRANFLYQLVGGQMANAFSLDISAYVTAATNPVNMVNLIDVKLFHGTMSPELRSAILSDALYLSDSKQRAVGALWMAAMSSEYAVLR